MSLIPSELQFGPGNLERAVSGQDIAFVPFVERVSDAARSLSEFVDKGQGASPLSPIADAELADMIRYAGSPRGRIVPLLVELARENAQSLGALAAATRRDVNDVELALQALREIGLVEVVAEQPVLRFSLRSDLRPSEVE